jgi:site-specific recombinase XerD
MFPLAVVGVQLDKKATNKENRHPVKLRVTYQRQPRYYRTPYSMTEDEYKKAYSRKPGDELRELRIKLDAIVSKGKKIVEQLGENFTFDAFKELMYKDVKDLDNVFTAYADYVKELKQDKRVGTAESYVCSLNSMKKFTERERLKFRDVDVKFLKKYEAWMLDNGNSKTTVGIYLRAFRHLAKKALKKGFITPEQYPFGEDKYIIPTGANIKKALTLADIQRIFTYEPENKAQEKARDFWVFIYLCNGINVKDLCLLKYVNIHGNLITFERAKTIRTKRDKPEIIRAPLLPQMRDIIDRWGNESKQPNDYIFPCLINGLTAERERELIKYQTKNINKQMKKIARKLGIEANLTTYVARHSFSTVLKRSGASVEYISDALGHTNIKTTQNYLAGFEDETLFANAKKLIDFTGETNKKSKKRNVHSK